AAGGGAPGGAAQPVIKQAKAVPVQLGLQTDTLAEIRSPDVPAGTTVITTRPDALQDKSIVAMSAPPAQGAAPAARKKVFYSPPPPPPPARRRRAPGVFHHHDRAAARPSATNPGAGGFPF